MSIKNYGVWVANAVRVSAERIEEDPHSPHIHLFYDDGTGGNFENARRASINVKSGSKLSEIVFWHVPDFKHPITSELSGLGMGFHKIPSQAGGTALDYIRGNLMDFKDGRVLPHDKTGPKDDIIDFVMPELQAAINHGATLYLFGEPYSDNQGIHDVHMNQGSQEQFKKYNGVWQDGGIIIHYPDENRFSALFLAFASQAVHTDDSKGHGLPGSQNFAQLLGSDDNDDDDNDDNDDNQDDVIPDDLPVAIIAALINPEGPEGQSGFTGQPEMVYLLNRTPGGISLGGWSLLNKADEAHVLSSDIWLAPGETRSVAMGKVPLSNKGGLISLVNTDGVKIDGVSYSKTQAKKEGELVLFR